MPVNINTSPLLRHLRAELTQPYTTLELACITAILYGAFTTRDLARHLNLTHESIDRTMKKLANRRVITRRPDTTDDFSHIYSLKPATQTFIQTFIASLKKPTNS